MAINKKFIHFKRKSTFQRELDAGNILNTSMVFISDSKQFYVNGQFFSENTLFDLNQLLENVSGELSETDTTNEAVIKLYKLIQEVNADANNIIKLLISEIDNLRETTNERIDQTDQILATGLSQCNSNIDELKTSTKELKDTTDELTSQAQSLNHTVNIQGETLSSVGGKLDNLSVKVKDHLANKDLQHIPEGGHDKQILVWKSNGTAEWKDLATMFTGLEDILAYGVEWDINVADPHLTRIGNMSLHKTLPIQSQLKGCIAQGNQIMYWLNKDDWNFKEDTRDVTSFFTSSDLNKTYIGNNAVQIDITGKTPPVKQGELIKLNYSTTIAFYLEVNYVTATYMKLIASNKSYESQNNIDYVLQTSWASNDIHFIAGEPSRLDGYDGTVRVYCPDFYIKSQIIGDIRRVWLSTVKIDDTWTYQHEILVDAYRCTVLNTVPKNMGYLSTLPVGSAISVVNTATYCRGGGNRAAFDKYATGAEGTTIDIFRSDLCKPRTNQPRSTFRTECRNAGSEMLSYNQYKNIFYWLYVVEYANFNCQEAYNAELTAEGFRQGGMGDGVTQIGTGNWTPYNGEYPLTPCGYLNELGNRTGVKTMTFTVSTSTITAKVPRWRGFDNPFGDVWTNLDGIVVEKNTSLHNVWTTNDPAEYTDVIGNKRLAGHECLGEGPIKYFDLGETAEIIPISRGGSTTTYKCDYYWSGETSGLGSLFAGNDAASGLYAGLGSISTWDVSSQFSLLGFRSASSFVSLSGIED